MAKLPGGLHVHVLRLIQFTEGKDSLERVLSQAHVDVHLKVHIFTKLITQVVNIHLAPVLLDVVGSLPEPGVQGNTGKVLRKDKSELSRYSFGF